MTRENPGTPARRLEQARKQVTIAIDIADERTAVDLAAVADDLDRALDDFEATEARATDTETDTDGSETTDSDGGGTAPPTPGGLRGL